MAEPIHLCPTAPLARRVLLPGDPGRALLLAQSLLEQPRMFNHNRGLWGYTGTARDGDLLTIQSTGMGGPSAAIVVSELADLGARVLVRVGTCGALRTGLELGEVVAVNEAIPADGTSRQLGAGAAETPDPGLLEALTRGANPELQLARTLSGDLFYAEPSSEQAWRRAGADVVEMETATVFTLARGRGLAAAALLIVSDLLGAARQRIGAEALREAELRMGEIALTGVAASGG